MLEKKVEISWLDVNFKEFWTWEKHFLILHWWWWSSDSWIRISEMLSWNYKVFVPDLPWFWKTLLNRAYQVDDYSDFVADFIQKIWIKNYVLLWHSNWWRISINSLIKQKIEPKILILNNSAGIKIPLNKKQKLFWLIAKTLKPLKKFKLFSKWRELFYKSIWWHDYLKAEKPFIKETFLNMIDSDFSENLDKIQTKTLLIWWENDTYTPLYTGKEMNSKIPNSSLKILSWEKHWIHLSSPKTLYETILNYLNNK